MGAEEKALRDAGLRATGPRRRVLEVFEGVEQRHLSAEDIYRKIVQAGERASLATVYRVLAQLEAAGLLLRHHLEAGKSVFELSRLGNHNHLICLECGTMRCFTDEVIDRRQHEIAAHYGYELRDYSLYTYVRCNRPDCPNRERKASDGEPPPGPSVALKAAGRSDRSARQD